MKISVKLLIVCLAVTCILSVAQLKAVFAQSTLMTDQQIELIRSNCMSVKNTLNQLHISDALLRVNRGQIYESMSAKLMERFNTRIANNNFDSNSLASITTTYGSTLNIFRSSYIAYEEQLSLSLGIDCSKQPVAFYDAISLARTKRQQVHTEVVKLNEYIDQYQLAVNQFEIDFQVSTKWTN